MVSQIKTDTKVNTRILFSLNNCTHKDILGIFLLLELLIFCKIKAKLSRQTTKIVKKCFFSFQHIILTNSYRRVFQFAFLACCASFFKYIVLKIPGNILSLLGSQPIPYLKSEIYVNNMKLKPTIRFYI